MVKKTNFHELAAIALLYNYEATKEKEIPYYKVLKYTSIINDLLSQNNRGYFCNYYEGDDELIYIYSKREDGLLYLSLNDNINLYEKRCSMFMFLPLEVISVSQQEEVLKELDLQYISGKVVKINTQEEIDLNRKGKYLQKKLTSKI